MDELAELSEVLAHQSEVVASVETADLPDPVEAFLMAQSTHGALPSEYGIGPPVRRRPLPRTFGAGSPGPASGPGPTPLTLL